MPQSKDLTPEQQKLVDLMLTSLNAFVPNLAAIREGVQTLGGSMDPRAAYAHFLAARSGDWPKLPSYEHLVGEKPQR